MCTEWAATSHQDGDYFKPRKENETGLFGGRTVAPLREGPEGWKHCLLTPALVTSECSVWENALSCPFWFCTFFVCMLCYTSRNFFFFLIR